MERHIQADNAFIKWMEEMSKNVVHIANAWQAAVKWADQHPQWIPVEEELPEEREVVWVCKHFNKEVLGEFYIYDSAAFCNGEFQCDNSCTVTHWMEIVPPQGKEE